MNKTDMGWRTVNAAIEVLRDMGIPLHFSMVGSILREKYWHWNDTPPTDEQVSRELHRRKQADGGLGIKASPGLVVNRTGGVWHYRG